MALSMNSTPLTVMIARAVGCSWAEEAAASLARLPVEVRWSGNGDEALGMATGGNVHLGVVDDGLPAGGGLDFVRRIRRIGLDLPCLLVCDQPSQRELQDAPGLQVYSVLRAGSCRRSIADIVVQIGRQVYHLEWPAQESVN